MIVSRTAQPLENTKAFPSEGPDLHLHESALGGRVCRYDKARIAMTQPFVRVLTPRVVLTLVVLAALAITVDTYRYLSHTWDEPSHIANGLLLLDSGKYIEYQHPPLARLATAVGPYLGGARSQSPAVLPVDFGDRIIESFDEGKRILYQTGLSYDRVLTLSRLGILPFLIILLLATYVWTRKLLGEWTAVLASFYLAATPIVLGNAGISTLDLPLTALTIASLVVYCRWLEQPTLRTGIALGAIAGAAIMSKFSAVPFLGLCFVTLTAWYAWLGFPSGHYADLATSHQTSVITFRRPARLFASRPHLKSAAVAFGALLVMFWLSYGGGLVSLADPANRPYQRVDDLFGPGTTANRIVSDTLELKVIPYFVYGIREGIKDLSFHNQLGHPSYLLGERGKEGWWNYYLVGLGVRTPLTLLLIGLIGLHLARPSEHPQKGVATWCAEHCFRDNSRLCQPLQPHQPRGPPYPCPLSLARHGNGLCDDVADYLSQGQADCNRLRSRSRAFPGFFGCAHASRSFDVL